MSTADTKQLFTPSKKPHLTPVFGTLQWKSAICHIQTILRAPAVGQLGIVGNSILFHCSFFILSLSIIVKIENVNVSDDNLIP